MNVEKLALELKSLLGVYAALDIDSGVDMLELIEGLEKLHEMADKLYCEIAEGE